MVALTAASGGRRARTRTEELRLRLADDIVHGRLHPGTALDEGELAERFGVSRTPVREAIRELAASGLIDAPPHRAAVVATPSANRLKEMFDVMAELEALCAGFSAEKMTLTERKELEELHASLAVLVRSGDQQGYKEINEAFHAAIYSGSHNDYLVELTFATRLRVLPFRRAQFHKLGRLALSFEEHDKVVTAILRGDREAAASHMRAHILTVEVAYESYAETV